MNKLYYVPLGCSARGYFINEIAEKSWENSLLVLPSGVLKNRAFKEGAVHVKDLDELSKYLLESNGYKLFTGISLQLSKKLNYDKKKVYLISRRTQELIVEEILQKYAHDNKLDYFNVLVEKKGFVKAVTSLIGQLSRSGAKMEEIYEALNGWDRPGKLGLKDREIAAVYTAYRQKLKKEDWFDVEGLYRLAVYVLQKDNPIVPWENLYFSEFYRFDGLQIELLRELKKHCNINVGLMYDPKRPEIFAATEHAFADLSRFLDMEKLLPELPERESSLKILAEYLGEESSAVYSGSGIKLLEAASREQEIRTVLRSVKKLLQKGIKSSEIIILLRDFSFYAGLRNLSDEYGIPVSLPLTAKLNNEPLTEFMYLLVKTAAYSAPAAAAGNLCTLMGCQAVKILFEFDTELLLRLKTEKLYQSADSFVADGMEVLKDEEQQELNRLLDLIKTVPENACISEYCTAAGNILEKLDIASKLGSAYKNGSAGYDAIKNYILAAGKLKDILSLLQSDYAAGGMLNKKITAQDFADILYEAVQGVELVLQKGDMNGVLITEAANIQGVYYPYVFLLGVREGEFPAVKTENWIYNDYERAAMEALGIDLPGTIAGLNEDKYFFAAAAAAALQSLTVSWYSDDSGGASAYVEMLQNTFADNSLEAEKCATVNIDGSLSGDELLENLAFANRNNKLLAEAVENWAERSSIEYIRESCFNRYSGVLQSSELLSELPRKIGSSFSASRLETYADCPFKFMVSYLWRQEEYSEMDEDINAADEGSLMHAAAAQFIGSYLNKSLAEYPLETLCEEMRRIFDALSREYEQSGKLKDTIFLTYQKENILKRLLKFVKAEYEYAKAWYGYKPLNVEMSFGPGTSLPLSLTDADGAVYNFKGRIDRIDADGERIFVTDYKRSKIPDTKDMKEGLDLQMPLYLLAAEQLTKDKTVLGGDYFSFKSSERDKGIVFDAKNKPQFFTAKSVGEWDSFVEETKQFITGYIKAMRSGNFKPSAKRICSNYCPAREICRRFNEKNNGGADGDV